jgi:hypothetical protein
MMAFIFNYYYNEWQRNRLVNPSFANLMILIMFFAGGFWLFVKFPLFVVKKSEVIDKYDHENVYTKKINFWPSLFIGIFHWTKSNEMVSLFSNDTLKVGIDGRHCEFSYSENEIANSNRICDILLTLAFSLIVFFLLKNLAKLVLFLE